MTPTRTPQLPRRVRPCRCEDAGNCLVDDADVSEIQRAGRGISAGLPNALARVASGDPRAMSTIAKADQDEVRTAATSLSVGLVVTRKSAVAVLEGFSQGTFTSEEAQAWASFVRRGYVAGGRGPIRPIDIAYEDAWEDAIVEAIARLDQIGDSADGDVTPGQVLDLLQLLGVS